ncbi:MAG: molybdate ABC transporter substrate-binding protein [Spirochaetales bacterium]|nr:molybdate ABC transporter substrate-binding protein [Spirochaetales bacterium]
MKVLVVIAALVCVSVFGHAAAQGEAGSNAGSCTLFVAASMTDVAEEMAVEFRQRTGMHVFINPASSGTLARQIEQGAECDVFVSASKKWVEYLHEKNVSADVSVFARNRLVLITPLNEADRKEPTGSDAVEYIRRLLSGGFTMLAMGDPGHVPAGVYGKSALENIGVYQQVADRIMPTQDVRTALNLVQLGEADYGIVYLTDAMSSRQVRIAAVFPPYSHGPIEYYCVRIKDTGSEAQRLFEYMNSEVAHDLLIRKGFEPAVRF